MEQTTVKSNKMKAFRIFYISNGYVTTIFKLRSTNGKQALQTFIRHFWNQQKYNLRRVDLIDLCEIDSTADYEGNMNPCWMATLDGFATLFSEELA